ncbi:Dyp-type peroxidase [Roseibium sp.]|uniref:Dyp-type peroxidase n=1 Tax=Roseibium sp. TaxID=1936156 RepID=UPI003BB069E4
MTRKLDLNDIQGNVTRAYGRYSFPFARYYFFHFPNPASGRAFVDTVRTVVTTAARWPKTDQKPEDPSMVQPKPDCTTNIALSFTGLLALGLPVRTLQAFPDEFIEGMKARAFILGDRDPGETERAAEKNKWDAHWDPIWQNNRTSSAPADGDVHMLVTLNAQLAPDTTDKPHPALAERAEWLLAAAKKAGVRHLGGIGAKGDQDYQSASAVFENVGGVNLPTRKEHFGFTDGIGDPVFEGQLSAADEAKAVVGRGKLMGEGWQPLATGEFVLGHPDESQELPPTAPPYEFMRNGTFVAFRKLHENVGTFDRVLKEEAKRYANVANVSDVEAEETLRAKMCGRWSDGVPLAKVPTYQDWRAFQKQHKFDPNTPDLEAYKNHDVYVRSGEARDFRYADDMPGYKCPSGAHIRRVNTRDYLDPLNKTGLDPETGKPHENPDATSALNKRRRILRRGLPYGPSNNEAKDDSTEQGVIMLIMCASLFRQFEFVQQQWIQYGLDFHQGNNTCPLLGRHDRHKRHTIPENPESGKPPYVMSKLDTFVECRGGDYFFVPSMTALRMMAMGIVDPT